MLYADDTAMKGESREDLQHIVYASGKECDKMSLKLNIDKSSVLVFSKEQRMNIEKVKVNGKRL